MRCIASVRRTTRAGSPAVGQLLRCAPGGGFGEAGQFVPFAADDGFLLGAGPALDALFELDGVCDALVFAAPDELHGQAPCGPGVGVFAGVVFGGADGWVIAAIGADVVFSV